MRLTHFTEEPFVLDRTRTYEQEADFKPRGLWLSDEDDYGWREWCEYEQFRTGALAYATEFRITGNVLHASTFEQVAGLISEWGVSYYGNVMTLDWEALSHAYDGILITPYQSRRRYDDRWYYGWDVASACVWNLSAIEEVRSFAMTGEVND